MTTAIKSLTVVAVVLAVISLQGCMVVGATAAVAEAAVKTTVGVAGAAVNTTGHVIGAAGKAVTGN